MEIVRRVKNWMPDRGTYLDFILYLSPINATRVPGSKRNTIKMLRTLLQEGSASRVTIVTTMWDNLMTAQAKERAESHFSQLRDDIWKELIDSGAQILRFHNDPDSAIGIIMSAVRAFGYYEPLSRDGVVATDPCAPLLYEELLERVNNTHQNRQLLRQEKLQLLAKPDEELEADVAARLEEVTLDLARFKRGVMDFGPPPPGYEEVPRQLLYQDFLDRVNEAREDQQALEDALDHLRAQPRSDASRKKMLQDQLTEAKESLVVHASKVVEFGNPPEGFELVMFPRHVLAGRKDRARQRLNQGVNQDAVNYVSYILDMDYWQCP
ncbi:hypothetical protein BJ165DRAFT_1509805 [Panaeolus papilionaceus]|nr:hypothetical protein BJ165DRAFT_1509805 [Panaeolus papilionaceus]